MEAFAYSYVVSFLIFGGWSIRLCKHAGYRRLCCNLFASFSLRMSWLGQGQREASTQNEIYESYDSMPSSRFISFSYIMIILGTFSGFSIFRMLALIREWATGKPLLVL